MKCGTSLIAAAIVFCLLAIGHIANDYSQLHKQIAEINAKQQTNSVLKQEEKTKPIDSPPISDEKCSKNTKDCNENASETYTFSTIIIKYSDIAIIFLTAVIASATLLLFCDSKDSSERQLRAYIWAKPKKKKVDIVAGISPKVTFIVRNDGQTPGYNVRHFIDMKILPFNIKEGTLRDHDLSGAGSKFVLNPTGTSELGINPRIITAQEIADMASGKSVMFIWGKIIYRDAFDEIRTTRFRMFSNGTSLSWHDEGNEAD